jgi:hypothetical protein
VAGPDDDLTCNELILASFHRQFSDVSATVHPLEVSASGGSAIGGSTRALTLLFPSDDRRWISR